MPLWAPVVPGSVNYAAGGFWGDQDDTPPKVWRFRDRVFIGDAVDTNDNRITGGSQTDWGSYANWAPRDSDLCVMSSRGALAITGMSRSSDAVDGGATISTWGLGGFLINDKASGNGRAGYFDVQHESGASWSPGLEVVVKNKDTSQTFTPYAGTTGTFGAWLVAGGDSSYGGEPAAPSNAAIVVYTGNHIAANANYRWNKGIVFDQYSLTGADGTGAVGQRAAIAVEMALGHNIRWMNSAGGSHSITATGTGASAGIQQIFQDDLVTWVGNSGGQLGRLFNTNNAVNAIGLHNATSGQPPSVRAYSTTDTNVDLSLLGQGTGVLRFGTFTGNADAAVNGYITVKDSAGNTRKLATIA